MTGHFEQYVEKVVLLIALLAVGFYVFQLGRVLAFFVNLGNDIHPEPESGSVRIVFQHSFSQTEHIEIKDMRMP